MSVCIDFTASNGELSEPDSLHKLDDTGRVLNQYERAITSVGKILEPYAYQEKFAVFGFGGVPRYIGGESVSHCFNLNGTPDPTVNGLIEMFNFYRRAVLGTSLSGPTYFGPLLEMMFGYIKRMLHLQMYHIMLILTDGVIHDMRRTKDLIVECSDYPLSIIIVGVGDADFEDMRELDGDEIILKNSKGIFTRRDIVQFVEFRNFMNGDMSALAEEVLQEVPEQVVSYMLSKGIKPEIMS